MTDDSGRDIETYLRAHPGFLAERPALYRGLIPPARVHGEALADHMAAMLAASRAQALEAEAQAEEVLAASRAAAAMLERVHDAVVAAVAVPDIAEWVTHDLPARLGLDAASLCCEGFRAHWRSLPPGAVARLLRDRAVVFRDRPEDAVLLHAEAAQLAVRDVLVRVPAAGPMLLALVSRDPETLPVMAGTQALLFLGRALGALIGR